MAVILDHNETTGVDTIGHYDAMTDTLHVERRQDVEPILEANKREANSGAMDRKRAQWHAGTIPNVIIERWINEHGVNLFNKDHWPGVRRLLNSNEYRWLRTGDFQV